MELADTRGFSIIELLAVVGIFMVLASISVVAWNSFGPVMALNGAAEALGDSLELCMHKAKTQKNEFFVLLNYRRRTYRTSDNITFSFPANSYVLVDDDGYFANSGTRQYNLQTMHGGTAPEFREEWVPDAINYASRWRNNNMIESKEIFKGPLVLGKGIYFEPGDSSPETPVRIFFSYRQPYVYWHGEDKPITRPCWNAERKDDVAYIRVSNHLYQQGDSSHDNLTHLRFIRLTEQKVEVYRPAKL